MRLLNRRNLLLGMAAATVSGCHQSTIQLLEDSFGHRASRDYPATPAEIDALPYATLGVRVGDGAPAVMVLAQNEDSNLTWVSSDRVVLVTQGGRLMKTAGLLRDLSGTQFVEVDPIVHPPIDWPQSSPEIRRIVDFKNPEEIGEIAESSFRISGHEDIQILGKTHSTLRIEERVVVERWRWTAVNHYWVGADRRVWRSQFEFCPQVPKIRLELLKPAI